MSALLFVVLAAGNCKLWTEFANRIHAFPWQCKTLRRVRWLHDAGIVLGCVAAGFAAFGEWRTQRPTLWWSLVAVWSLGYAKLVYDAGRHLFRSDPPGVVRGETTTVDVAAELGERPTGDGPARALARVPGNDSFRIDVERKTFALPGYPATEPLRILHLTDWHFSGTPDMRFYERATELCLSLEYDIVVFTGDLVDRLSLLDWLPDTLGRVDAPLGRYFVLGNHDRMAGMDQTRAAMLAAGWTDASAGRRDFAHAGGRFALTGDERPWAESDSPAVADAFHIALAHSPDRWPDALARGAVLTLAGHNHGGQVVLPLIGPVYSPSAHGVRYAAGLFREGDAFLHVGRGLGGIHPLRLR